jgi:hypothetical protein
MSGPGEVTVRVFALPKDGSALEEYEDAAWPASDLRASLADGPLRCAVADGATEASFARQWAALLAEACGRGELAGEFAGGPPAPALDDLRRRWRAAVDPLLRGAPWYVVEKARQGADATLAGVTLEQTAPGAGAWQAVAVGDSCLFHVAEGGLLASFPMQAAGQFGSRPDLISSNPSGNDRLASAWQAQAGAWQAPCAFYLMTDALAAWFLGCPESRAERIRLVGGLQEQADFEQLVFEARRSAGADGQPLMRNDDATLLRIEIGRLEEGDVVADGH